MNTAASSRVLHLKQEANSTNLLGDKQNLAFYKTNSTLKQVSPQINVKAANILTHVSV